MNKPAAIFHMVFWTFAFVIWLLATAENHPSWTLRIFGTAVLVSASALFACGFTPRELTKQRVVRGAVALIACGIVAAILINIAYMVLHGPDPRRFSLVSNFVMDTAVVLINTLVAAGFAVVVARVTGRPVWWLKPGGQARDIA